LTLRTLRTSLKTSEKAYPYPAFSYGPFSVFSVEEFYSQCVSVAPDRDLPDALAIPLAIFEDLYYRQYTGGGRGREVVITLAPG
jgi:hypothetical protein